jgi:PKD repeat protein
MRRLTVLTVSIFLMCCGICQAQLDVDFTIPATACRNEIIPFQNNSDLPGTLRWDFCASDLNGTYSSTPYGTLVTFLTSIELVEDNGTWYGFATSRNNELIRMNFGTDPHNPDYTVTSLGNPGNLLSTPDGVSIVKDGDVWYGLVTNLTSEIIRLKWTALNTPPEAVSLSLNGSGKISQPSQVEIEMENGEFVAVVVNGGTSTVTTINFHATMANNPAAGDLVQSDVYPGAADMTGVTVIRQCENWEIYTIASNKIYRVVKPSLLTQITAAQVNEFSSALASPVGSFNRIRSVKSYDRTYFYFTSFTGGFIRGASWQTGAAAPEEISLGTTATPSLPFSLAIFKNGNTYGLYVGGHNSGSINAVKIVSTCGATRKTGTEFIPKDISYATADSYRVGLDITYAGGTVCSQSQDIIIVPSDAPVFDYSYDNICKNSLTTFSINSAQSLTAVYDYGDGTINTAGNHSYSAIGSYETSVVVTAPNTCTNRAYETIEIFNAAVAAFQSPVGLICTNNEFTFANNTPDVFNGNLAYEWRVDNLAVSTERDLKFAFTTVADKTIKLKVSIPGCSNETSQVVSGLEQGPSVGFVFTGKCQPDQFVFTNNSSGDISGYSWTFGDGNTSTATNTSNTYTTSGTYPVTLNTFGTNGCVSSTTTDITVYSIPAPAFALDLPPFSCSGTASQFHDMTPPPPDSNIQSWAWAFGDSGNGTGKNPTHTYANAGNYNVRLTVTTDQGCTNFKEQEVTITPSPVPAFSNNPACASQATQFTNLSTGNIAMYQWRIGNSSYTIEDPAHVFLVPGAYAVQLSITDQNNCSAVLDRQLIVPSVPVMDIDLKNACSGQPVVFTDITPETPDGVALRTWTFNYSGFANGKEVAYNFAEAGSYPVQLQVQHQSGCVYSITRQFTINPSPVASFSMSVDNGPPPLSVAFTNTSTNATSWQWNFNDGTALSTEKSPTHIFQNLGQYAVDLKAIGIAGCSKTTSQPVSVIIPFNELALSEFSVVRDGTNTPSKGYVRVSNAGNYRINSFTVYYETGGGVRLKETVNASLNPGQTGLFLLSNEFTGVGGFICAELADDGNNTNNKACAAMGDESIVLETYPNPADSYLNIETIQPVPGQVHVRIYNSSGGEAYNRTFDATIGLSRLSVDIQNLSTGIYVVVVSSSTATSAKRVMISR